MERDPNVSTVPAIMAAVEAYGACNTIDRFEAVKDLVQNLDIAYGNIVVAMTGEEATITTLREEIAELKRGLY